MGKSLQPKKKNVRAPSLLNAATCACRNLTGQAALCRLPTYASLDQGVERAPDTSPAAPEHMRVLAATNTYCQAHSRAAFGY
ncbi:MAG: hypothetical protein ABTS16_16585, partial [Candidatus Accumulibacter phosphatis]